MRNKFEYYIAYTEHSRSDGRDALEHKMMLDKRGKEGWELVSTVYVANYNGIIYYFKRKKEFNPTKRK